jgi:ParB family chromosome partitioning protein
MSDEKRNPEQGGTARKKGRRTGLGKGLDALFPDIGEAGSHAAPAYFECDVDQISPNPYQPRSEFGEQELADLAGSIKSQGVLQPLLVRVSGAGYELIAGERRLRAARMAGVSKVPVILKEISNAELIEISIIENIQRENLNPMEEAEAYQRLMEEFGLTQDKVAARVGKNRATVANFLRLNQLPAQIKAAIRNGDLSMGHARTLLGADTAGIQRQAFKEVIAKSLSVRETEKLIQRLNARSDTSPSRAGRPEDIHFSALEQDLSRRFGTKVQIRRHGQKGRVEIEFYSNEDLDRLLNLLKPDAAG